MDHHHSKELRARRRAKSVTIAHRRRAEYIRTRGIKSGVSATSDTFFSKQAVDGCSCVKRKKGNPKVACGMCDTGRRDRIVHWRQEARALRAQAFAGRIPEEG